MKLYLIRHAKAEDAIDFGPDEERALTRKGRKTCLELGANLAVRGVRFGRVITSPLVRAVQTAELLAVSTSYDDAISVDPSLVPGGIPEFIRARAIEPYLSEKSLALIGHEPSMGALASYLLAERGLALPKLGVLCLRYDPDVGHATLEWFVSPKHPHPTVSLDDLRQR